MGSNAPIEEEFETKRRWPRELPTVQPIPLIPEPSIRPAVPDPVRVPVPV